MRALLLDAGRAALRTLGLGLVLSSALGGTARAQEPGERVDDFRLVDHRGNSHQLHYHSEVRAVVLAAQANDCESMPAVVAAVKRLQQIADESELRVFLIHSETGTLRETVVERAAALGVEVPILMDETQLIGESLGFEAAGDVRIVDPATWTLAYRGSLLADSGTAAADALRALLAGEPVAAPPASAPRPAPLAAGCRVERPGREARAQHARISYSETIAPMLIENCVTCHRDGGIGPWAMRDYGMIVGFSPMIREVLRTQRMPPWHADPHYLPFSNSRSLTPEQVKTLVHWIEAGSPRGEGPDPLAALDREWPEWVLGEPDLIVEIPAFDVPATGVLDYRNVTVPNELERDVWVRAVDFLPGDRSVVHHIIASTRPSRQRRGPRRARSADVEAAPSDDAPQSAAEPRAETEDGERLSRRERLRRAFANRVRGRGRGRGFGRGRGGLRRESSLSNYVPGAEPLQIPGEAGILVEKGTDFHFQMHYTTSGKATTDVTRMGLYFMDAPPSYQYRSAVLANPRLRIPAGVANHQETASYTFRSDALVYSVHPHAHFRGSAARFVAHYPDGRSQVLLNVPRYDFNWQSTYVLAEPELLPAGTRVEYTGWFDNSEQNRANPDPARTVRWGQQSWDEMLYGVLRYRNLEETPAANASP